MLTKPGRFFSMKQFLLVLIDLLFEVVGRSWGEYRQLSMATIRDDAIVDDCVRLMFALRNTGPSQH